MILESRVPGWLLISLMAFASVWSCALHAQGNYPNKPIRLVIPVASGASTPDIVGRMAAQGLGEQLRTTVIADNRPGANAKIGMEIVAKSTPDGYTLLLNTSALILNPALYTNPGYDPIRDFTPVTLIYTTPNVYVTHPSVPAKNIGEFVAYAKSNPGKLAYGSGGIGNSTHLAVLLLFNQVGLELLHVPYKSGASAVIDLLGGRVQFYSAPPTPLMPFIKDGRIKALAVASLKRIPSLPDVPTLHETVASNLEVGTWGGVMAPAKTPPTIVRRLRSALVQHFKAGAIPEKFESMGALMVLSTPEEYAAYIKTELHRWGKVIRDAGIQPE